MKKLIERSYEAIKARGLIDENTTREDFEDKMSEELFEVKTSHPKNYIEECVDLATVCIMQICHLGYDVEKEFEKVVIKNEKRSTAR